MPVSGSLPDCDSDPELILSGSLRRISRPAPQRPRRRLRSPADDDPPF
jgi:hypothetical protein